MKKLWNLAIVEPNSIVCAGLSKIFARTAFKERVEFASMAQFWESLPAERSFDAFLIDVQQSIRDFRTDIARLRELYPETRIIVLADCNDREDVAAALDAGVHGYICKNMRIDAIIKSLELVVLGESVFPAQALASSSHPVGQVASPVTVKLQDRPEPVVYNLSTREIEVLKSLGEGKSNKEIASHLEISDSTVKVHVKAILRKLRMKNRTEAALWVSHVGLMEAPVRQH